ncbi:MAG: hypothetical protein JO097_05045 [Acidobacteriaceae bacterium]|nr:hypothetical protein [Acidobacteriaceae bacterium]MBV9765744.1 hypothetical protein [Acidobacteriaceae bacterium]
MGTVVNLDPDVEELLRREVRERNVEFDRVLNEAVRAGLLPGATGKDQRKPFMQKTYSMGPPRVDLTMTVADELEDEERIRKMRLTEAEERIRHTQLAAKLAENR